ncbi:MAG: PAS domain S-box protein [Spirochaetes bacterium]|nr:PAS domain S-box protein [Spirochaetota bacterium]
MTNKSSNTIRPQEILGLLYDAADIGMCVTDANRRFVTVNRAYEKIYGYTEAELAGEEFTVVLPEDRREEGGRIHDRFLSGESEESSGEWVVRRKDGSDRTVLVTAGRLILSDGRRYKVTTVYDITERSTGTRDLERELEKRELLLREAHHRVKNHLASLEAMLQMQLRADSGDIDPVSVLTESVNRVKTMSRLYDRLSRAPSAYHVDLKDYIEELIAELVSTTAPTHIEVTADTRIAAEDTDVDTAVTIGLVANELVTNSLKHAITEQGDPTQVHVTLTSESTELILDVSDSGPGVPEDFLERNRSSLGIQLVTAVAQQHGGSLELMDSARAWFRVRLPRHASGKS